MSENEGLLLLAVTLLFFTSVGLALALQFLPVGECDRCDHCRLEKKLKRERQAAADHRYSVHQMRWGECDDPACPERRKK